MSTNTTYLDRPVLTIRPDFSKFTAGQLDDFTFKSEGMGWATPWKVTSAPKRTVSAEFIFGSHPEQKVFRKFFSDLAGRRKGFWFPMLLNEYRLAADAVAGATVITVDRSGLTETWATFGSFKHLVLLTWDKLECYKIQDVAVDGDFERITLTSGLQSDLVANDAVCGGLLYARLSADVLKFTHKTDIVSRASVQFTELPAEYATAHAGSAPIHLYEITRGAQVWRLANWAGDLSIAGHTWGKGNITHTSIKAGIDMLGDQFQLKVATDDATHPLRARVNRFNTDPMTLRIYRADFDTLTADLTKPVFVGSIGKASFEGQGVIVAEVSSIFRLGEYDVPRLQVQRLCNNQLFDPVCKVSEATYTTAGTITAINSGLQAPYVDAAEFGAKATAEADPNWFALGKVICGQEIRLCVGQDEGRLYLNAPFQAAEVGAAISATAGCDKRITACQDKFSGLNQYLGFPYIPNIDPSIDALVNPKPDGGKKL